MLCVYVGHSNFVSPYNWLEECFRPEGQSKFSQNRAASAVIIFQLNMNWRGGRLQWGASPSGLHCIALIGQWVLLGDRGTKDILVQILPCFS